MSDGRDLVEVEGVAWKSLGKHDTKGKDAAAALEKEGSENNSC